MPNALIISSPQNARIKHAVRLRERRGRRKQKRTIVDGRREIEQLLKSDWVVCELFFRKSFYDSAESDLIRQSVDADRVQILVVDDNVFEKLAFGDRDEGIVATAETPDFSLESLDLSQAPLICVLDQVEKPGNIGAVLRTIDSAGVDALILSSPLTDVANPNTIRASLGAIFRTRIAVAEANQVIAWLRNQGARILAARVEDGEDYAVANYDGTVAIVLGNEANGLGDDWTGEGIRNVAIPMRGQVDSLNVSASAAVLLYEATRQR